MSKRKDSVALFEVLGKGKAGHSEGELSVPGWIHKDKRAGDSPSAAAPESAAPAADETVETLPQAAARDVESAGPDYGDGIMPAAQPVWSLDSGRVRVSLNYISCLAVALGAIVALGAAFWLGRYSVARRAASELPLTERVPKHEVLAPGSVQTGGATRIATPVVRTSGRQAGKWYLIIDRMAPGLTEKNRADAEAIVAYLARGSVPATVDVMNKQMYAVCSGQGFDDRKSDEAVKFARQIETLGEAYKPERGATKYTFRQHNKDKQFDPSFFREPEK